MVVALIPKAALPVGPLGPTVLGPVHSPKKSPAHQELSWDLSVTIIRYMSHTMMFQARGRERARQGTNTRLGLGLVPHVLPYTYIHPNSTASVGFVLHVLGVYFLVWRFYRALGTTGLYSLSIVPARSRSLSRFTEEIMGS